MKLDKGEAVDLLQRGTAWLAKNKTCFTPRTAGLLLDLPGDGRGRKDSTIKHVMSGVNPQGCQVSSFKQPSSEELDHDFMWRYTRHLPERGRIGIFNRSYYEEVLVVRVHPEILEGQKLPRDVVGKGIWDERLADIAHFEDYVTRQGTKILKFFLTCHARNRRSASWTASTSRRRIGSSRLPTCRNGSSGADYMHAFEEAIRATASKHSPWFIVPADNKWFTRLVVAAAIVHAVENF